MSDVKDNEAGRRFELHIEGQVVFATYRLEGDRLYINHVEAPEALRGTGAAGKLMEGIVGIVRERHYKVIPVCSYAHSWFRRHAENQDLLAV